MITSGVPVFGVGSLHHLINPARRTSLLRQALDLGFRAFDVAPAYGNGLNELELGKLISGFQETVRVSTKFGIPVDLYGERHPFLAHQIRVWKRLLGGRAYGSEYRVRIFTPQVMQRSLEGSLRRLRREWVDDFMIHEPIGIIPVDELTALHDAADRLKEQGKIRRWGVAGYAFSVAPLIDDPRVDVIQAPLLDLGDLGVMDKELVAYNTHKAYSVLPSEKQNGFIPFVKDRMRELGADLIVSTRKSETLAGFQGLFD